MVGNPLRQVIVNTHSPAVVGQVPDDSLLVTELREALQDDQPFPRVCLSYLPDTWRPRSRDWPLYAFRGGRRGAGASSTDSKIAANIERGF